MYIEEARRFISTIAREIKMFQIELLIELLLGEFSAVHAYSNINLNVDMYIK